MARRGLVIFMVQPLCGALWRRPGGPPDEPGKPARPEHDPRCRAIAGLGALCRSRASARSFGQAAGDGPAGRRDVMGPGAESRGAADACHIGGRRRPHAPDGSAIARWSYRGELCLENLGLWCGESSLRLRRNSRVTMIGLRNSAENFLRFCLSKNLGSKEWTAQMRKGKHETQA